MSLIDVFVNWINCIEDIIVIDRRAYYEPNMKHIVHYLGGQTLGNKGSLQSRGILNH